MLNSTNNIIKHKLGLFNLAEELGNVSKACKIYGFSIDTFYRYKEALNQSGTEALLNVNRKVPNIKNRVDLEIEKTVINHAIEYPAYGQARTSNELRKQGIFVSASS